MITAKLLQEKSFTASSIDCYLHIHHLWKLHPCKIFLIQISIKRKCEGILFTFHRFLRYKHLWKDHSMGQTVVWLSSMLIMESELFLSKWSIFWRVSCFSQNGQSSGEWAVSFKMVNLLELLPTPVRTWDIVHAELYNPKLSVNHDLQSVWEVDVNI